MKYGEWHWDTDGVPQDGKLVVTVDLEARVVSVFRDGYEIGAAVAMLGTDEHPTPTGNFPILTKERHNVSEKYGNAPMPWTLRLTLDGTTHDLEAGGYAYIPPGMEWQTANVGGEHVLFHWIRKRYQAVAGIDTPSALVTSDAAVAPIEMPDCNGVWGTTRFVDPTDLRHDMHVNIVTFQPGGRIPFAETHVMEHGLYVLQGKGRYRLNDNWVDVEAGDYMWLRAFCPQACIATGDEPFRYLLYKDVNRHMPLGAVGPQHD